MGPESHSEFHQSGFVQIVLKNKCVIKCTCSKYKIYTPRCQIWHASQVAMSKMTHWKSLLNLCTMHIANFHCTSHIVHCKSHIFNEHCTLYIVHCTSLKKLLVFGHFSPVTLRRKWHNKCAGWALFWYPYFEQFSSLSNLWDSPGRRRFLRFQGT